MKRQKEEKNKVLQLNKILAGSYEGFPQFKKRVFAALQSLKDSQDLYIDVLSDELIKAVNDLSNDSNENDKLAELQRFGNDRIWILEHYLKIMLEEKIKDIDMKLLISRDKDQAQAQTDNRLTNFPTMIRYQIHCQAGMVEALKKVMEKEKDTLNEVEKAQPTVEITEETHLDLSYLSQLLEWFLWALAGIKKVVFSPCFFGQSSEISADQITSEKLSPSHSRKT